MSQPCRRFVLAISIARQEFRLHVYDHSGVIHSRGHNIHSSADLFLRLIYVLNFGNLTTLGFDPTFVNPTLSPLIVFRPSTKYPNLVVQKIHVDDKECAIVRCIFTSPLVRGRATTTWAVSWKKEQYVVKDYWTHISRKNTEADILERISGVSGVPELVAAWTVPLGENDQSTDLIRPSFLFGNMTFETRIHRRLMMTPVGDPLSSFTCIRELVSIFIDIVDGQSYY